jgi:cyclic 2,3-diphosphoglycerate synthetase
MKKQNKKPVITCLVDGEHYLSNLQESLEVIAKKYTIKYLVFIGGTEKIGTPDDVKKALPYKVFFAFKHHLPDPAKLGEILAKNPVEVVLDLSDEPILNYISRFEVACEVLFHGAIYRGSDFEFQPLRFKKLTTKPSLGIWGSGKRVGKTAIGGMIGRIFKKLGLRPAIVTLSRGGPRKPIIIRGDKIKIDLDYLLDIDAKGMHASSDCFQDALTAGVPTFGCRRCGGGFAGKTVVSVVDQGVRMAQKSSFVGSVIVEGSGASVAEIKTDKVLLVIDVTQPEQILEGYMTPLRIKYADFIILNMCEDFLVSDSKLKKLIRKIRKVNPKARIATTVLRPFPFGSLKGKKVMLCTTAPKEALKFLKSYLEKTHQCKVVAMSENLSVRPELIKDLKANLKKADVLLTEHKAASIAVAAKEAKKLGIKVVLMDNIATIVDKGGDVKDLEKEIAGLLKK